MRVYIPYHEWEDWINGMWRKLSKESEEKALSLAVEFTGDYLKYGAAMRKVILEWPNTMLNNLTNPSMNKRAFLGRCACCYELGLPEYIVRIAWKKLTNEQRSLADNEAQTTIDYWKQNIMNNEKTNKGIRSDMGKQMLLRWDSG